jgi:hypothetical protein
MNATNARNATSDTNGKGAGRASPPPERHTVERLVPAWLAETERHDPAAAHEARTGWERGSLSARAAQDLATWVTARVTDTGFNEDEGPRVDGPVGSRSPRPTRTPYTAGWWGRDTGSEANRTGRPVSGASLRVPGGLAVRILRTGPPGGPATDRPGKGAAKTQHADDDALGQAAGVAELRLATGDPDLGPPNDVPAEDLPLDRNQAILQATKQVGSILKRKGHRFALAGSVAVHAHGGTQNLQHDVDFAIRPQDAESVAESLREAGLAVY